MQQAFYYISKAMNASNQNKFDIAVLESLKQYVYTFKENKIYNNKKNSSHKAINSNFEYTNHKLVLFHLLVQHQLSNLNY